MPVSLRQLIAPSRVCPLCYHFSSNLTLVRLFLCTVQHFPMHVARLSQRNEQPPVQMFQRYVVQIQPGIPTQAAKPSNGPFDQFTCPFCHPWLWQVVYSEFLPYRNRCCVVYCVDIPTSVATLYPDVQGKLPQRLHNTICCFHGV